MKSAASFWLLVQNGQTDGMLHIQREWQMSVKQITSHDDLFLQIPAKYLPTNLRLSPQTSFWPLQNGKGQLAVNSLSNAIDIISTILVQKINQGFFSDIPSPIVQILYERGHLIDMTPRELVEKYSKSRLAKISPIAIIGLCPTYACNYACIYCYQSYARSPQHKIVDISHLAPLREKIGNFIRDYKKSHNDICLFELFGGEPLLLGNEEYFDWAVSLCREHEAHLIITTNGYNIVDYIDRILINRDVIAKVSTTIDGINELQDLRRRPQSGEIPGHGFDRIISGIKYCLGLEVPVKVEMNIDKNNAKSIQDVLNYCRDQGWLSNPYFSFGISKIDDRMLTGRKNMLSEIEALLAVHDQLHNTYASLHNFKIVFLKTAFYLAKAFNIHYGQNEYGRDNFNYCWATSNIFHGYYYDPDCSAYRCTFTVGNPEYNIGTNASCASHKDIWRGPGILLDDDCLNCVIAGYCAGGCTVSRRIDKEQVCIQEKKVFADFFAEFKDVIEKYVTAG
ncbi:MAG: 4Fe-4S cluster-binding domain-containing protein [Nitrospirae bacterium]|nr:4Fe-4S cluster-binding domain-containing protein [Nitrospirota bacterium]